ncbi:MAG TPA: hypothetical protein VFS05_05945 [Gemmatimonadaceae bacterium]|nr:hypothetical protein [Gemmatimonadaceae bacterium]
MRTFTAPDGREWEAVLGKESYGTLVVLFTPRGGGEARKSVLGAESQLGGALELEAMSDEELRARLAESVAWG